MSEAAKLESQLERLLAQDLSQMGYQARIRHQQRIEELRAHRATRVTIPANKPEQEPAEVVTVQSAEV